MTLVSDAKLLQTLSYVLHFFHKLQRGRYCEKYTYIHNQIFYCFCFCHWCHSIPLHQSTKIIKKNDINRCDAFIIRFILYHFVDFHAFDTHLFHRQDYRRIKLRLMIAVAIAVDFEKYDNFHCLPCKKTKFVCHLLFLDVSLL